MVEVEITVSVKGSEARVRKVVIDEMGRVAGKYALSCSGQWIKVAEGEAYPAGCSFRVMPDGTWGYLGHTL